MTVASKNQPPLQPLMAGTIEEAAISLLGCHIIKGEVRVRITEVEAYSGADDPASHAFRGITKRNAPMFGPPGHAYVYFCYGMHWMFNISALMTGTPGAVLIRAAQPICGIDLIRERRRSNQRETNLLNGPGKVCQALGISGDQNGVYLFDSEASINIEQGKNVTAYCVTKRIGIAEGKGESLLRRYVETAQ